MRPSVWLYSCLLRTYPARLRKQFGDEMLRLFEEQLEAVRGRRMALRLHARTLFDWCLSMPSAHLAEHRRRTAGRAVRPWHHLLERGLMIAPTPAFAVWISVAVMLWCGVRRIIRRSERATG